MLAHRDSYLSHLKAGIKPDTLAALTTAPLHISTLFPDEARRQAEQDIANFGSKGQLHAGKKGCFHPYECPDKRADNKKPERPAWKNLGAESRGRSENSSDFKGGLHSPLPDPAKLDKVSHCHKLLCKPSQEQLLVGGFTSAYRQKCSRAGPK